MQYTGVAESIESEDATTWTVTLKDGWTFHDGTPVTAESFVNAWNYTALSTNAQGGSYFFANDRGLRRPAGARPTTPATSSRRPPPTEMSGLEVVDDTTFTVTLSAPFAQFPVTVGYNAFYPLPESFFEDPEAAGKLPDRQRPVQGRRGVRPGPGHHPDPVRGLRR